MVQKYKSLFIAAAIGVVLLTSIGILAVTQNKNSSKGNNQVTYDKANLSVQSSESLSDNGASFGSAAGPKAALKANSAIDVKFSSPAMAKRKIILNGSMVIESTKFDLAIKTISVKVKSIGGYIESSQINGIKSANGNFIENRTASYTIRIPSEQFEGFMNQIGTIGVVTSKNSGGEDITAQYIDSAARLKSQKIKEVRLIDILKKAERLTDVLAIETELENTRFEIENLTGSLKQWDNLVSYSTLTLSLTEVTKTKVLVKKSESMSGRITDAFSGSIELLVDLSKGLLIAIVSMLPFLVIVGCITALVLVLTRRAKHKNRES